MNCSLCKEKAVFSSPLLCKNHFMKYFETKVKKTIKEFKLLDKKDNVAVAVSGGKDSTSLLFLLNKLEYKVSAIAVDEGIIGYRDKTLSKLTKFCRDKKIPLKIVSFEKSFSKSLDDIIKKSDERPCSVCGILRRSLLNNTSKGFDAIATGHNLDDESQAIIMNLLKGNISLLNRLGPISGKTEVKRFTKRIKPFYLCLEKEIMAYSFLIGLDIPFGDCPYVGTSFRLRVRDMLNEIEVKMPGTKKNIVNWFLGYKKKIKKESFNSSCSICGEPSSKKICNACEYASRVVQLG